MATAFAIYSATDNSLNFYKRDTVPVVGDTFNERAVTKIWTDFETTAYTDTNHPAWQKDNTIKSVVTVDFVDTITPISLDGWFRNGGLITSINFTNLDTSDCTNMGYVFRDCSSLTHLDVSNFNTSQVTNMKSMFYNCCNLEELDVSSFDTGKVTNMAYMFYACMPAKITGFETFNTSNVTTMQSMFYKCAAIGHIDLSGWNTSKVTNISWMFNRSAGTVDFTGWDTSKVTTFLGTFSSSYFTYLDLSSFEVGAATTFDSMFFNSTSLKTILVSHNWNETFKDGVNTDWMFENCFALMGNITYSDMHEAAEEDNFEHMTGLYATTNGGYLTLKYEESEDEGEGGVEYDGAYLVLGSTLRGLANSMRNILGTPQKISLKNFNRILQKQINTARPATLIFKDQVHNAADDTTKIANIHYSDTNFTLQTAGLNRFYLIPTIVKGSIITLTNVTNLTDSSEIVYSGDITRLGDSLSFIINGDATIQIVKKEEAPITFNLQ